MRYGVLADVHGNLPALEAVLGALERERVDAYLCAGDLVGWGPFPDECVELVAALEPVCVAGNHDLIALGRLSDERCGRQARDTLRWTRATLGAATRAYLDGLPLTATAPGRVVLAHGALDDAQRYTRGPGQARAELARLADEYPQARVLILGHTHRAAAWRAAGGGSAPRGERRWVVDLGTGGPSLLNPGAVGQSRERLVRARFMVLDLERDQAEFHAVDYDVGRTRDALQRLGLPEESVHLRPSPLRRAVAWAREAAWAVRG